jgi:hypothetical protein
VVEVNLLICILNRAGISVELFPVPTLILSVFACFGTFGQPVPQLLRALARPLSQHHLSRFLFHAGYLSVPVRDAM